LHGNKQVGRFLFPQPVFSNAIVTVDKPNAMKKPRLAPGRRLVAKHADAMQAERNDPFSARWTGGDARKGKVNRSAERYSDAPAFAPNHVARIDFLARYDQRKLIRYAGLRPYVECGTAIRQIVNDTADRRLAEPNQGRV
jgi:hypothetical protein